MAKMHKNQAIYILFLFISYISTYFYLFLIFFVDLESTYYSYFFLYHLKEGEEEVMRVHKVPLIQNQRTFRRITSTLRPGISPSVGRIVG